MKKHHIISVLLNLLITPLCHGQINARLLRHPDVSDSHIVFSGNYDGNMDVL